MEKNCFGPKKKTSSSDAQPSSPLGGQKKRLSLAIELLKSPAILFLDEPTSGLDSASAAAIMDLLDTIANKFHKVRGKNGFDGRMKG